jgi:predicted DNA-binding transcriptional regulator YafY
MTPSVMFSRHDDEVRASRLLSMLLMLHTRGQVSARQLAEEFEVSQRTVYRDVEALNSAGVPVYAVRGRAGGFALLAGYRTRLTGLTADEADTLFLTGMPSAAADLGLGGVLAATQLKLLAALPPDLRERASRIRDRVHLDAPGWLRETETPPFLAEIADAVWAEHRVQIRYERANHTVVERTLEPLGLVLKAGTWYLVAGVPGSGGRPRTYRVSRILAAVGTGETFERPAGFTLQQHWDEYQRDYENRAYTSSAVVRLSPAGQQLLFLVGTIAARSARADMGEPEADGWVRTTIPIESVRHGQHALMQLGAEVEVLEPAELRGLMIAGARALAARYEVLSPDGGAVVAP